METIEQRVERLEQAAAIGGNIMAEQADTTRRLLRLVEQLTDRVLELEARTKNWQFMCDRVFELEEWQRGAR